MVSVSANTRNWLQFSSNKMSQLYINKQLQLIIQHEKLVIFLHGTPRQFPFMTVMSTILHTITADVICTQFTPV